MCRFSYIFENFMETWDEEVRGKGHGEYGWSPPTEFCGQPPPYMPWKQFLMLPKSLNMIFLHTNGWRKKWTGLHKGHHSNVYCSIRLPELKIKQIYGSPKWNINTVTLFLSAIVQTYISWMRQSAHSPWHGRVNKRLTDDKHNMCLIDSV